VKVAIYGHSQAQPTGMGDTLKKALQDRGHTVIRLGLAGKSDRTLLQRVDELGPWQDADRIVLYGYSNGSEKSDTIALLQHLGLHRTRLVLPPINLDRETGTPNAQRKQNMQNQADFFSKYVPTYWVAGHRADFHGDQIHMRAGSVAGKKLVARMLVDMGIDPPAVKRGGTGGSLLGVAVVVAVAVWITRRGLR